MKAITSCYYNIESSSPVKNEPKRRKVITMGVTK